MFHMYPANSGLFWLHDLFWLLIVVALVAGAILVVRSLLHRPYGQRPWSGPWPHTPAMHELDLRYARGEISRDEYLQRRADLSGHGPQPGPPPAAL